MHINCFVLQGISFSLFMLALDLRHLQSWTALERSRIELRQCIWYFKIQWGQGMAWEPLLWEGVCKMLCRGEVEPKSTPDCDCCCLVVQLCLTLCDPMHCNPPEYSVHGILQARILGLLHWQADSLPLSHQESQVKETMDQWTGKFGTGTLETGAWVFRGCGFGYRLSRI